MLSNNQNQTTMNKLIIVIALFLVIPINVSADNIQEIYLTVEIVKPGHNGPIYRSPTRPIVATLNNAILTFKDLKEEYILTLWDENDTLVYTMYIVPNISNYVLPTNLKGNYKVTMKSTSSSYIGEISL
ncbi:hypothetical protein GCM10019997_22180 [Prevotella corporis]